MLRQSYDFDADALYVTIGDADVARTVEVDSGTLVDLDGTGAVVGIEVIRPNREWPLDAIIDRFAVPESVGAELRSYHPRQVFVGTINFVPA